jgi:hypothetical protein
MSNTAEATKTSQRRSHPVLDEVVSTTRHSWLLLVTGVAWVVIAIAALFGVFSFVAGQIASAFVVRRVGRGAEAIGRG